VTPNLINDFPTPVNDIPTVARPIGAVIFGHSGDRVGRKAALIATLLITGLATFAVGLVPDYVMVGVWGPNSVHVQGHRYGVCSATGSPVESKLKLRSVQQLCEDLIALTLELLSIAHR
jgi:hypothetical protein